MVSKYLSPGRRAPRFHFRGAFHGDYITAVEVLSLPRDCQDILSDRELCRKVIFSFYLLNLELDSKGVMLSRFLREIGRSGACEQTPWG